MPRTKIPTISVVLPVYNESAGLSKFHKTLVDTIKKVTGPNYEIIYINDGSTDETANILRKVARQSDHVKVISLSRNFGKEIATTAGIHVARGQAVITLDADGQHPVDHIDKFVKQWQKGSKVVIGLRTNNQDEGLIKRYGSKLFYKMFNAFTRVKLVAGATDFRLIDRSVQQEFIKMTERNRITRGLIDWLGYNRDFVEFKANPRQHGKAGYSFRKLFKLAIDSVISLSLSPLYIAAYIGAVVLPLSTILGFGMLINALAGDPLSLHATGSAYVIVLLLFLIGVLLVSQGIIGLYLSHIHVETQNRPLYIVDKDKTINI